MGRDYYAILGVDKSADDAALKKGAPLRPGAAPADDLSIACRCRRTCHTMHATRADIDNLCTV